MLEKVPKSNVCRQAKHKTKLTRYAMDKQPSLFCPFVNYKDILLHFILGCYY